MRLELEKIARDIEERCANIPAGDDAGARRFLEGHAAGIRRALQATAPQYIGVKMTFSQRTIDFPLATGELALSDIAAVCLTDWFEVGPLSTKFTLLWRSTGAILGPDQLAGYFGFEEGEELEVVMAPNIEFERPWLPSDRTIVSGMN